MVYDIWERIKSCLSSRQTINTTFLNIAINGGAITTDGASLIMPGAQLTYVNKFSRLKEIIYSTDINNVGFEWENIDSPKVLSNPSIKVCMQSTYGTPQPSMYIELRNSIIKMLSLSEGKQPDIQ